MLLAILLFLSVVIVLAFIWFSPRHAETFEPPPPARSAAATRSRNADIPDEYSPPRRQGHAGRPMCAAMSGEFEDTLPIEYMRMIGALSVSGRPI